jgi:hypothetical protein
MTNSLNVDHLFGHHRFTKCNHSYLLKGCQLTCQFLTSSGQLPSDLQQLSISIRCFVAPESGTRRSPLVSRSQILRRLVQLLALTAIDSVSAVSSIRPAFTRSELIPPASFRMAASKALASRSTAFVLDKMYRGNGIRVALVFALLFAFFAC